MIMASAGYPIQYDTGFEIAIPAGLSAQIFAAGVRAENGKLLTAGGRVLGVTATGEDLSQAVSRAYEAVAQIRFENAYYRTDIGKKALAGGEQ